MKKIVFVMIAAFMLFCIAGCAGTPDTPNTPGTPSVGHTHTFDTGLWTYDENSHWRPSTCEHFTVRGEEAAHTMKGDKCEVCGYSVVGMTAEEFKKDHAEQAAAFARMCAGMSGSEAMKIASEFVWFETDENNKLIALTYLYTAESESEGTNTVNVVKVGKLNKIDLKEIAAGKVTLQYQSELDRVSSNTYSYQPSKTETYRQLAETVCKVYRERFGAEENTPLLRLPNVRKAQDEFGIDVFDILENGYIHYYIRVSASENATADDLIGIVDSGEIAHHADAALKAVSGTLVYQNIKG